jgi:phosphoglycerate dehydrogenase-like enzyme
VPLTVGGLTLGIVGYGEIGRAVAARARGFGLRLVATSRRAAPAPELDALYRADDLPRLLAESDYVVLLTPLTPETRGLIDEAALRGMRPSAWLINVARGEVVQESALLRAIDEGWIAGAALDVFAQEPLPADSRLWRMPNLLLTPHNSGVPPARLAAAGLGQFVENVGRYARGEPLQNLVDKEAGY